MTHTRPPGARGRPRRPASLHAVSIPMTVPAAKRESVWTATAKMPSRRRLERDLATDVCVVGAGMAGLSVAYTLAKAGKSVAVLDDGPLAGGMTGLTTAHLSTESDNRYVTLEKYHGG